MYNVICEGGRLISDIIEVCEKQNIGKELPPGSGHLIIMDIEKAFESLKVILSVGLNCY